ncbi:MAG: hypothetical protein EXR75_15120 [Myxococcales bacterium]|nr:hypothetical protein [Myxococcales bacterium]
MVAERVDAVVVGAGAAGVATAWALARRGVSLRLFDDGVGATSLAGGAIDDQPWEEIARAASTLGLEPVLRPVSAELGEFVAALGLHRLGVTHSGGASAQVTRLATEAGCLRIARGHDRALLDLSLSERARILVPRVPRPEWDADSLARSWTADPHAQARGFQFIAVDAELCKLAGEDRIGVADFAARHDDEARLRWLGERIAELLRPANTGLGGPPDAVLLGPWLGANEPRAEELSRMVGVPVGEALGSVGGPPGLRFEAARRRLLERLGVARERAYVTAVCRKNGQFVIEHELGPAAHARALVLAIGGMASGGIVFDPPERYAGQDAPERVRPPFRASLEVDVTIAAAGRVFDIGSSLHGPALDRDAWPTDADPGLLERIGIVCTVARAGPYLYAAGDAIADRPRTFLEAVASGLAAAHGVLRELGQT